MSTPVTGTRPAPPAHRPSALHWDRMVLGLLVAALGVGWLLDGLGVAVPWRLAPAAAVAVVGLALLLSLAGGRGRGGLVSLGIVLLLVAAAVGVGADRFAGPVGDRTIAPSAAGWPAPTRLSAGTVTVDLTRDAFPATGRLDVEVGAGRVVVLLPADRAVRVHGTVVMGTVVVDGVAAQQGVDLDWTSPDPAPVDLVVAVGAGDVEVTHERA